ncbi:MAG TPA: hypothetical protein VFA60_03940 [Terriglobales bacterium]|nr:hypothetical protein [Terriglobales bacterium]
MARERSIRWWHVTLCAALLAGCVWAQQPPAPGLPASANDLVREAVNKEAKQNDRNSRFMYRGRKQTPEKTETKEYVETNDGTVARLIQLNDQPLAPDVQKAEQKRLQRLLSDPNVQRDRQRKQKEDENRVTRMVRALPDAFLYEYDGVEPGKYGESVKLKFKPNPNFNPETRELKVYEGMEGQMYIDLASHRLLRLEAHLFRDVDFGWGILGRLYKGGKFVVEQSRIEPEHWETTGLTIDMSGRALLFKSLRFDTRETASDFRRVAPGLTLAQGVELLQKFDPSAPVSANVVAGQSERSAAQR